MYKEENENIDFEIRKSEDFSINNLREKSQ